MRLLMISTLCVTNSTRLASTFYRNKLSFMSSNVKSRSKQQEFNYKYPIINENQKKMVDLINNYNTDIVIGYGPAGTGKTLIATQEAIKLFKNNMYEKIIITRPLVTVEDEEIGFLPGTADEKLNPWVLPILDYFRKYFANDEITKLKNINKLELVPLGFMRGRTFDNTIIIADEMQNASKTQMKLLLTRIGLGSKIIILGDLEQSDLKDINGLEDLLIRLHNSTYDQSRISLVSFTLDDIKRAKVIKEILKLYE